MFVAPCVRASFRLEVIIHYVTYNFKSKPREGQAPSTPATDKKPSVAKSKKWSNWISEMAIFIASTKSISRGKGQSAVASASYRAGVELQDERYGKKHDYSNRFGVMSADIILPSSLKNQNVSIERGELWNKAEKAENRKDARVAREWLVNLPYELDEQQRKELAHNFAQELADRYGVIADCAIHKPTEKEIERGADARNFHAHIMLTTRTAELNANNEIVLKDKSTAELSDKKRRELGLERMSHEVKEVRQLWERVANEKLAEHGIELIDSRSYKDRNLDIEPQLKMGSVATKKERDKYEEELEKAKQAQEKGEPYEIDRTPATQAGLINQIINERNELVFNSRKLEQADDREFNINESIEFANKFSSIAIKAPKWANRKIEQVNKRIDDSKRAVADSHSRIERRTRIRAEFEQRFNERANGFGGTTTGTDAERVSRAVTNSERAINDSK